MKKRIANAVERQSKAVTTTIQEVIFLEMGIGNFVNMINENDQELMICFYKVVAKEEMACDQSQLGPDEFVESVLSKETTRAATCMLKLVQKFSLDNQFSILDKLHQHMENGNFDIEASVMST
ncbi:hypothetical protein UlMin_000312 [Ulmus minor]